MKHFLLAVTFSFACTVHAQYCTSGGPTSTVDSQVLFVRIVGQNDSIRYTHQCPGVIGVQNLTNLSTSLVANTAYQLSVQFGTCNGNYAGAGEAWIDFDQNAIFDPSESIGTWTGTPPVALTTWTFTVPAMAQNGTTRLRVMQHEGAVTPPLDPCASFLWGSVMDFSINVSGGVDCSGYPGDEMSDAIPVTAMPYTHSWNSSYCYSNHNFVYPSPDVYYLVTPSAQSAIVRASLCGSSYDTYISAYDAQGNLLAYNDDSPGCAPASEINIPSQGHDSIYVIIEGWGVNSGNYILNITEDFVGIDEHPGMNQQMFPNPADQSFVISNATNTLVTIYDITGNAVIVINSYASGQISTGLLPAGVYTVEIIDHSFTRIHKLVIAR